MHDNIAGRVLTGVARPSDASAATTIASKKLISKGLTQSKKSAIVVAQNLGGSASGIKLSPGGGVLTQILIKVASKGRNPGTIVVRLKIGPDYDTAVEVGTFSVTVPNPGSATHNVEVIYGPTDSMWLDVISAPPAVKGPAGLSISFNFF